jgi:hypothetical protein
MPRIWVLSFKHRTLLRKLSFPKSKWAHDRDLGPVDPIDPNQRPMKTRLVITASDAPYRIWILWISSDNISRDKHKWYDLEHLHLKNTRRNACGMSISSWSQERIYRDYHEAMWMKYAGILISKLSYGIMEISNP